MSAETGIILSKHPITDRREALYDIFYEANPKILKALIDGGKDKYALEFDSPMINTMPNSDLKYNTLITFMGDGCVFGNTNYNGIIFSYGRWDISRLAFKETYTIGVHDVPFEVKLNTTEGINQALYGLLDGVEKVRDVAEYPGVVEYKCTVNEDNLIAIFTKWVGRERIYYNEFTVYAKTYIPSGSFEDSDFVE